MPKFKTWRKYQTPKPSQSPKYTDDIKRRVKEIYPAARTKAEIEAAVPELTWKEITGVACRLGVRLSPTVRRERYLRTPQRDPDETKEPPRTSTKDPHMLMIQRYCRRCKQCGMWILKHGWEAQKGLCDGCFQRKVVCA